MRYRLRTLLIVLAIGPMVLAEAWFADPGFAERMREWWASPYFPLPIVEKE